MTTSGTYAPTLRSVALIGSHYWLIPTITPRQLEDILWCRPPLGKIFSELPRNAILICCGGKRLYYLIQAPKRFVRINDAGHNDLGVRAVMAAKQFIKDCAASRLSSW